MPETEGRCLEVLDTIIGAPAWCSLRHGHGGAHHDNVTGGDWTSLADERWAVWSYTDGRSYISDPPTQEAAERNAALLTADGESCEPVPEDVGQKMANAYAHGRHDLLVEVARLRAGREVEQQMLRNVLPALTQRDDLVATVARVEALMDRWEQRDPSGLAHVALRAALHPEKGTDDG